MPGPSASSRVATDRDVRWTTDAPSLRATAPIAELSLTEVGTAAEPTSASSRRTGPATACSSERNGRVLRIERRPTITDDVVLDLDR